MSKEKKKASSSLSHAKTEVRSGPAKAAKEEPDIGSVDKIRDIIFGNQMRDYDTRFSRLEERLIGEVKDLREEFIQDFILPALKANAVYEGKYLLATALGRPLIAKHLVELAIREKAGVVAHGCTGKGNDQVRFEVSVKILNPDLEVIAPLRVWAFKSREEEIDYAKKFNLPVDVTKKKPYSIDRNLWGVSIEAGVLEDLAVEPPESVYQITKSPSAHPGLHVI